ncbi:NAD-dependent epimerase/dehydratase family protein [Mangrovimonas spongiae]|uniref:dTDP-4-dehydrorhamnose reductase n=1 Tax=Mangrovimonas spongiae TaxID=2494697 RepID=A0A3R9N442_9FLAO|nr:sugar nucleotide-binding protein [Mangrovimonas spongiae]RSK38549.1 NAD-dependent epimerase/dehydratase family protein [Mangrovimonas spongiae]
MKESNSKHRILILGASGFLGQAIYKELCSYFNTFGTYRVSNKDFEKNQHYFQYNVEEDDVIEIIEATQPTIIISALRGDFSAQVIAHRHVFEYLKSHKTIKVIFLSSANVFDAYSQFPSYENDKTLSHSVYGHFKIKIEDMFMRLPKKQYAIVRLPMVFGAQSPRILEIKQQLTDNESIEIFPNLVINVTSDKKVTQQIHYIINRNKTGIYHLGSDDLVHHNDFIKDVVKSLGNYHPTYKQVYTTNDDRFLAVLPKDNKLPKHLATESKDVLKELHL